MAIAVLIWVVIVAPETLNFMWTIHRWGPEDTPPAPSVIRWFTGEPNRDISPLFLVNRGIAWVSFSAGFWSLAVLAYRLRRFAAGSTVRRTVIVWGSVLLGSVLIPTLTILPRLMPLARVPYAGTLLIGISAFGAFAAAALIARWSALAEAEASASIP